MNNSIQNIESFDINQQFQILLKHSQNMFFTYEDLLNRIQALVSKLDDEIVLVFHDIIDLYNKKIENDNNAIFKTSVDYAQFNEMKRLQNHFISLLEKAKKEGNNE